MSYITENIKDKLKNNIKKLIEAGYLKDAKILLDEYKQIDEENIEIYTMMGIIAMVEGDIDKAEKMLLQGVKIEPNNHDNIYNLAYLYRLKEEYLLSLELFEKLVFMIDNDEEKNEIINIINDLEYNYENEIKEQLIIRMSDLKEKQEKTKHEYGEKKNLHLMYDSQFCDSTIHYINSKFPNEFHKFLIISNRDQKLKFMDLESATNAEVIYIEEDLEKIITHIDSYEKLIVHFLFDWICEVICRFNINKPIYWIIWGGDLYNYIDIQLYDPLTANYLMSLGAKCDGKIDKYNINYIYRKSTIRKIQYCLTVIDNDYDVLNENFITCAEHIPFSYPNPAEYPNPVEKLGEGKIMRNKYLNKISKYENIILIGNSANPSNNHLDIFNLLRDTNIRNYCVVVPLSYGGYDYYVDYIIKKGKEYFKDKFVPLTEYISGNDYYDILSNVDVAIYNHNRQQAVGNIRILLSLNKVVYLKENTSTFKTLNDLGLKGIRPFNELKNIELDEILYSSENNVIIQKEFGLDASHQYMLNIF